MMRVSFVGIAILLPLPALAGDPIPGVDVSLEQIPGGIYQSQQDCTRVAGNTVVIRNGVTFCKGPATAISHNSSRSNFSMISKPKKKKGGAGD